jgi:hypothetical protein
MFHPPANAPHAAVAYRTTALNARWHDRAGGGGGELFVFKTLNSSIVNLSRIIILSIVNSIISS